MSVQGKVSYLCQLQHYCVYHQREGVRNSKLHSQASNGEVHVGVTWIKAILQMEELEESF